MAPQAIDNAQNGLGNDKPSAHVFLVAAPITRIPHGLSLVQNILGRHGA
jgi:hypothetical protein